MSFVTRLIVIKFITPGQFEEADCLTLDPPRNTEAIRLQREIIAFAVSSVNRINNLILSPISVLFPDRTMNRPLLNCRIAIACAGLVQIMQWRWKHLNSHQLMLSTISRLRTPSHYLKNIYYKTMNAIITRHGRLFWHRLAKNRLRSTEGWNPA